MTYNSFVLFIFAIKILFILLSVTDLYFKYKHPENPLILIIQFWRQRIEFIFVVCMALLLIYIFNPYSNTIYKLMKEKETKVLLFLFGIILLVTAHWKIFFQESPTLKYIQTILGRG